MSKIDNPIVVVKRKEKYRLANWSAYNEGLKQRGSLTLWLWEDVAQQWYHQGQAKKGGQFIYADACILLLLTLKVTFKLPFRQLEGFACSLMALLKLDLQVPDYSQICRRQKGLPVPLGLHKRLLAEPLHLVIDSSGLKVYGEGEWKVRRGRPVSTEWVNAVPGASFTWPSMRKRAKSWLNGSPIKTPTMPPN